MTENKNETVIQHLNVRTKYYVQYPLPASSGVRWQYNPQRWMIARLLHYKQVLWTADEQELSVLGTSGCSFHHANRSHSLSDVIRDCRYASTSSTPAETAASSSSSKSHRSIRCFLWACSDSSKTQSVTVVAVAGATVTVNISMNRDAGRCDVGLEEGEYKWKLSMRYSIVYYYNGAQRYEQFLQVSWLYRALILLGLALCLPSASVSSVLMVLCRYYNFFLLTSFCLPFTELSLVRLTLDMVD